MKRAPPTSHRPPSGEDSKTQRVPLHLQPRAEEGRRAGTGWDRPRPSPAAARPRPPPAFLRPRPCPRAPRVPSPERVPAVPRRWLRALRSWPPPQTFQAGDSVRP